MKDLKKTIGNRLKRARKIAGFSQGEVGRILKIHRPTISEIEAGRRNVKIEELVELAKLYELEVVWFMEGRRGSNSKKILNAVRELKKVSKDEFELLLKFVNRIKNRRKKK